MAVQVVPTIQFAVSRKYSTLRSLILVMLAVFLVPFFKSQYSCPRPVHTSTFGTPVCPQHGERSAQY